MLPLYTPDLSDPNPEGGSLGIGRVEFAPPLRNFSQGFWGNQPNVLQFSRAVWASVPSLIGQQGELQENRSAAVAVARELTQRLEWLNLYGPWPINAPEPAPVYPGINVCSPSLQGPCWPSQYFHGVQQELVSFVCEIQVELRKALTALDRLLGCIDHVLLVIRRFVSSNIRLFCSVRWEQRRWFLFHGARPPKTVQGILDFFIGVCSGSSLAY